MKGCVPFDCISYRLPCVITLCVCVWLSGCVCFWEGKWCDEE